MTYEKLLADGFLAKPAESDNEDDKKSFAKEIAEKNKEIREQYRIIIQETTELPAKPPKKNSKKK